MSGILFQAVLCLLDFSLCNVLPATDSMFSSAWNQPWETRLHYGNLKSGKFVIILYIFNSRIFLNLSSFGFQDFSLCCQLLLYELDNLSAVFKTLPFPAYTYALGDFTQDHALKNISYIDHHQLPLFYIQLAGHLCWLRGWPFLMQVKDRSRFR